MSYPSEDEKKVIKKFRSRVFDILKPGDDRSDQFLVRWIRAQNGNLDKAELMIRKSFDWRQEYGVDDLVNKIVDPHLFNLLPYSLHGMDTLGHPVVEILAGDWDFAGVVAEGKETEFILYVAQFYERIMQKVRDSNVGRNPWEFRNTQFTSVVNWAGFSYAQFVNFKAMQYMTKAASLFETNYPETLYKCFYVNCPTIFPKVFALLKLVLTDKTISKLKVYGMRQDVWEPKVKRLIPTTQLSPAFGGNAVFDHFPSSSVKLHAFDV